MEAKYGPCDKAYRDHWIEAEGFHDTCEYDWRKQAKLTPQQRITLNKLSGGRWDITVAEDGTPTLMLYERAFVKHNWRITYAFRDTPGKRLSESECITEFGLEKWIELLDEMDKNGDAVLPGYHNEGML